MTADWKKKPLDRAKPRDDIKALRAEIKALNENLAHARANMKFYAERAQTLASALENNSKESRRYDALRMKGVLVDYDGEFKFLQGKDLDAFWDGRDEHHRIVNQSMMQVVMQKALIGGLPNQWILSAEL